MMRWLAGVTAAIGLVALWALPPSAYRAPEPQRSAEQARFLAVSAEVGRTNAALRALRWADSLAAETVSTAVDGVAIGPPDIHDLDPADLRGWIDRQRARLTGTQQSESDFVVGMFWVQAESGAVPDLPVSGRTRAITFVGEREGTPYCVRALPYARRAGTALVRFGADVGPCALYARYGLAGERVQAWLDASSLGFARTADFARLVERRAPPERGLMRLFGMSRPYAAHENLVVQACLAGRAPACERAVTDHELIAPRFQDEAWLVANTPASSFAGFAAEAPFGYLDEGLLYEWEAEFGREAFARFWTSPLPVADAFETAFGEPLGPWVLAWAEERIGLYRAAPAVPAGALGWCLLVLAGLAAWVTGTAQRRRVGA